MIIFNCGLCVSFKEQNIKENIDSVELDSYTLPKCPYCEEKEEN